METYFTDVILPVAIPNLFTYRVPREMNEEVREGKRVVVPFGKRKKYSGIIRHIHTTPPKEYEAKYLETVLDKEPLILSEQFRLWEWVSSYYMCTIGEVMNAALPSSLKLASETKVVQDPEKEVDMNELDDQEVLVMEALEMRDVLSLTDIADILGKKTIHPVIRSLLDKKVIIVEEELRDRFKPKKETFLRLAPELEEDGALEEHFGELEKKAPKQLQALMAYMQISMVDDGGSAYKEVRKRAVKDKAGVSPSVIDQLVRKGILQQEKLEVDREVGPSSGEERKEHPLTDHQQEALSRIHEGFEKDRSVLVHGVTSSGKTEVYVKLIEECLEKGQQVLYLLPEIALTTQLIGRIRKFFGDRVGVYHSRFNDQERAEVWKKVGQEYDVILGARSSVFLPFQDLGLVIIDEEHDASFKQFDPAPRYNGRDTGIILARFHGAHCVLGSATPSVESYYNARKGRFGFAELTERYGGIRMPEIQRADIKKEMRKRTMQSHFTSLLMEQMKETLEREEQVILFQNRRGFAPMLSCEMCGWVPECKNCDISLTYHKGIHQLSCHYCGFERKPPVKCQACGNPRVKMLGFGTEKIEEELEQFFPGYRVVRMDLDTTRKKQAYNDIIRSVSDRSVDILVGTQMVTKGLDFGHVGLVGVLNADRMLKFPDFRAHERAFQLMLQVAGRAGRRSKRGKVIIQSYDPYHQVIDHVVKGDYEAMFKEELLQRRNFHYPPFHRLIELTVRHKERELVEKAASELSGRMRKRFGKRVLGPEYPPVPRVRGQYRKGILLKIEKDASPAKAKKLLHEITGPMFAENDFKRVRLSIDVDPA